MTLRCRCGAVALTITNQSYGEKSAVETYECEHCGRTGSLIHDRTGTRLSGCLE